MKRSILLILAAAAVILAPSCKSCSSDKADKQEAAQAVDSTMSAKEYLATEDLKINMGNLLNSLSAMKPAPFINAEDEKLSLTNKEKMLKPTYLADPKFIDNCVTLTQKYRAVSILTVDRVIADLYEMDITPYDEALAKLAIDINDPALKDFSEKLRANSNAGAYLNDFCDKEYAAGRANLFWEAVAAGLVEQTFICTQNIDKFMEMFDDESACNVTYDFITVQEGIKSLFEFYPEMKSLNEILKPLYVINAINVDQLRSQLTELKGEINVVRQLLMR